MSSKNKKPITATPENVITEAHESRAVEAVEGIDTENTSDAPSGDASDPVEAPVTGDETEVGSHTITVRVDTDEAMTTVKGFLSNLGNLHARLTKSAHAIKTTGGQENVFALHQLELLTGRLKAVLPAGIAATEDPDLKSGLEALLSLL